MYNRHESNACLTSTKNSADDVRLLHIQTITHGAASTHPEFSLMQLLRQHQHQEGWILLVAPSSLPDKGWAEQYQLSLHNVLVIHQKQIVDLNATLQQALTSSSCKVVINFANQLDEQQLDICRKLAVHNNIWFYQNEQLRPNRLKH